MKDRKRSEQKSLDEMISDIHGRGNDVEIRYCREGKKVYEVSRRLVAIMVTESEAVEA